MLQQKCGLSHLTAAVLVARGLDDPEAARDFLRADFGGLSEPSRLPDAEAAISRIRRAVEDGGRIRVFGDYDCDGITGTALLVSVLRDQGAVVDCRLPVRLRDGYGLGAGAVDEAARDEVDLLITVDCGVTAHEEIERARRGGVDVIVTDHHQPEDELPAGAAAVVNPRRADSDYPFAALASVGVCYQLARALVGDDLQEELDLVAVGTVADMVPLVGENRLLVRSGLLQLNRSPRPLLAALARVAGVDPAAATADDIAFRIAPRINAPGRLDDASPMVRALLTDDQRTAARAARWCDRINRRRRHLTDRVFSAAQLQVETARAGDGAGIVVCGENWHPGVVGLVATRLAEAYRRPAVVLTPEPEDPEMLKGSGRGVSGWSLLDGLRRCEEHLHSYGGHAAAAGLNVRRDHLPEFRAAFDRAVRDALEVEQVIPTLRADAEIPLRLVHPDSVRELHRLGPFGTGNPRPLFLSRGVRVRRARPVGEDGRHLALQLERESVRVIGFHLAEEWKCAGGPAEIDMVYSPEIDRWRGRDRAELVLEALRPAGAGDGEMLLQRLRRRWRFLRCIYPDRDALRRVYRFMLRCAGAGADEADGEAAAAGEDEADGEAAAGEESPGAGPALFDPEGEVAGRMLEAIPELDRTGLYCALDMLSEMELIAPLSRGNRQLWLILPDPPSDVDPDDSPTYARSAEELRRVKETARMDEPDAATIARTLYRFDG